MRIFRRRSRSADLMHKVDDARGKRSVKAALVTAAGVVGLTAASARISTLRRRGAANES